MKNSVLLLIVLILIPFCLFAQNADERAILDSLDSSRNRILNSDHEGIQVEIKKVQQILVKAKAIQSSKAISYAYTVEGQGYELLDSFNSALNSYKSSLEIRKAAKYSRGIILSNNLIGGLYHNNARYKEALPYFRQSLQNDDKKDTTLTGKIYRNFFNAFIALGDEEKNSRYVDSAATYNRYLRDLVLQSNRDNEKSDYYYNVGLLYYHRALLIEDENLAKIELDSSYIAFKAALDVGNENNDKHYILNALGSLGQQLPERLEESITYLDQCFDLAKNEMDTFMMLTALYNKVQIQENLNLPGEAILTLARFESLVLASSISKDSSEFASFFISGTGALSVTKATEAMKSGTSDIYEHFVVERKSNLSVKAENLGMRRNQTYFGIGGLILFAIISLFAGRFYFANKLKQQKIAALEVQKEQDKIIQEQELAAIKEREEQAKILHQQEMETLVATSKAELNAKSLELETKAREDLRTELHNGASAVMVAAKWAFEARVNELEKENHPSVPGLKDTLALLNKSYQTLRAVLHRIETDPVSWVDELRNFCVLLPHVRFDAVNMDQVPNGGFGRQCRNIVQELVANALKYAEASIIDVQLARLDDEDMISITVTDNGKGFEADKYLRPQMSNMDSIGTEDRPLPGISSHGLDTVQKIVQENNGTFDISSSESGTQIFIDLPFPTTK